MCLFNREDTLISAHFIDFYLFNYYIYLYFVACILRIMIIFYLMKKLIIN